jgi:hypothetical protein
MGTTKLYFHPKGKATINAYKHMFKPFKTVYTDRPRAKNTYFKYFELLV